MTAERPPERWRESVDPALLARLQRRAAQPGVVTLEIAQRIFAWVRWFAERLPLLDDLARRRGSGERDVDRVPIVHARRVAQAQEAAAQTAQPAGSAAILREIVVVRAASKATKERPSPPLRDAGPARRDAMRDATTKAHAPTMKLDPAAMRIDPTTAKIDPTTAKIDAPKRDLPRIDTASRGATIAQVVATTIDVASKGTSIAPQISAPARPAIAIALAPSPVALTHTRAKVIGDARPLSSSVRSDHKDPKPVARAVAEARAHAAKPHDPAPARVTVAPSNTGSSAPTTRARDPLPHVSSRPARPDREAPSHEGGSSFANQPSTLAAQSAPRSTQTVVAPPALAVTEPRVASRKADAIDVDDLVDKVQRKLLRRLAAERERRGGA